MAQKHFLFHLFRMDKAEHPMPPNKADALLHYLKRIFTDKTKNDKGRK